MRSSALPQERSLDVSVLTPIWNRANLLSRVFTGLMAQKGANFEWIVADDGSTDDVAEVLAQMARAAPFPIIYLRAHAHVGKARMDNAAIAQARGEMILWCDSDDYLTPDAIAPLMAVWRSIPAGERLEYSGLTALAATEQGVITNPFPGVEMTEIAWNDMTERLSMKADMVYFVRADLLKANPFPEVDLVIPESVIWSRIGNRRARFVARVVTLKEYRMVNAISFSGMMSYNRGRAHALALSERELRRYPRSTRAMTWKLVTYLRYCIHGEIGLARARALWADSRGAGFFWPALPVAAVMALRDILRGKVVRSHREFDRNRNALIDVNPLN